MMSCVSVCSLGLSWGVSQQHKGPLRGITAAKQGGHKSCGSTELARGLSEQSNTHITTAE